MRSAILSVVVLSALSPVLLGQQKPIWDWKHKAELPDRPNFLTIQMDPVEKKKLKAALTTAMKHDVATIDLYQGEDIGVIPKATDRVRVKLVDLDADGTPEVIAQASGVLSEVGGAFCGATGNCRVWIFKKEGNRYRKILDDGGFQFHQIGPDSSKGFKDLIFTDSEEGEGNYVYHFVFRGRRYHLSHCWLYSWYPSNKERRLRVPVVTPISCGN